MYNLLTYLEIAAFISSLIAWPQIRSSKYMRLFPFLLFIIAAGELFGYWLALKFRNNLWFYNLLNPFIHFFYFAILYYAIESVKFKMIIKAGVLIYSCITISTYFIYCYKKEAFNNWMYMCGAVLIIILVLRKLYELLQEPAGKDFLKSPFFYMLFFTLLFYTITIPNFIMLNWIAEAKMGDLTTIINNASNAFNILLYAAYTIAFLWIRKTGLY